MAPLSDPSDEREAHDSDAPAFSVSQVDARALVERLPSVTYVAQVGIGVSWSFISPQVHGLLGVTPQEWCSEPTTWERMLHPDDRDEVLAREAEAVAGRVDPTPWEYRLIHRDGHVVWVRDDASLTRDTEGRLRWHGVLSDITVHKQTAAALARRAAQQAAVARLGERALAGAALNELMNTAVADAARILEIEQAGVLALTPDREWLMIRAGVGVPEHLIDTHRMPITQRSMVGLTLSTGHSVVVNDWATETRCERSPDYHPDDTHNSLTVRIDGRDAPWGILGLQALTPRGFDEADQDFARALANIISDAIQRKANEDDIRHQALHDPLTGLPNRVLFLDRLGHALSRRGTKVAVLFMDLDQFKLVNDSMGHSAGDALLIDVAPRLREAVRPGDTIGRFGGDEFGILLEDIAGERAATEVAERIAAAFARPFVVDGTEHFASASIGIAMGSGGRDDSVSLVRDADAAMYRAKDRGRRRYELFDAEMRARALERFSTENDLRRALERNELRLAYQPIMSMADQAIVGAEALLRWEHPRRGLIDPDEFIPLAEECGLIEQIGAWVLDEACRQAARWHTAFPDARPLSIAVNLSGRQLMRREIPEVVANTLRRTGIEPGSLILEITESVLIDEQELVADMLRAIGDLGVQVALDDFGTGYSSLSYLTRLPINILKLDRSFVDGLGREEHDTAIATAVVRMAQALALEVTAEGVETELQLGELQRLGCAYAQGFLLARPMPAEELTALLHSAVARRDAATPDA